MGIQFSSAKVLLQTVKTMVIHSITKMIHWSAFFDFAL